MSEWKTGQLILEEYTVEKELGRGGMGRVWLVKNNSTGRRFAVKQALIRDDKNRKAFLTELQTWIDLPEHPNIAPCRFFRTVGDEIVIFADFIDGGSLADWISKGKLTTLEQILDVAIQFAWGLHVIHERGLIHQDVKPGNVLMTADGVPMVTDFGLARARMLAADGLFVSPTLPQGQQSVLVSSNGMTPAYASPEQRAGQSLSRKTDIWSWGVSVLDMFMGGVSCMYGGHIAAEVLEDFFENRRAEEGSPEMSEEVSEVLRRCFANDPAARWSDIDEVGNTMIECLERETGHKHTRTASNPRTAVPSPAVSSIRDLNDGRKLLDLVARLYEAAGLEPPPIPALLPHLPRVADFLALADAEPSLRNLLSRYTPEQAASYAELLLEKILLHCEIGDFQAGLDLCDTTTQFCTELLPRVRDANISRILRHMCIGILNNRAMILLLLQRRDESLKTLDALIAQCRAQLKNSPDRDIADSLAIALLNKCGPLILDARDNEALTVADDARKVSIEYGLTKNFAMACGNRSVALRRMGRPKDALKACEEAISAWERILAGEHTSESVRHMAQDRLTMANVLQNMGREDDAIGVLDRAISALAVEDGKLRSSHARSVLASALGNKASLLCKKKEFADARGTIDRAISIWKGMVDNEGRMSFLPELGVDYATKGRIEAGLGMREESVKFFDLGVDILDAAVSLDGRNDFRDQFGSVCTEFADAHAVTRSCAGCGVRLDVQQWRRCNASVHSDVKKAILDGCVFVVACPKCGRRNIFAYDSLYHDPVHKLLVAYLPENHAQRLVTEAAETRYLQAGYTMRIVDSPLGIAEKALLADNGLWDVSAEVFKLVTVPCLNQELQDKAIEEGIYIIGMESDKIHMQIGFSDKKPYRFAISASVPPPKMLARENVKDLVSNSGLADTQIQDLIGGQWSASGWNRIHWMDALAYANS